MVLLHQFLEMMATEGRATRSTLSAYDTDLRDFYKFIKPQYIESVTLQDIQAYLFTQNHLSPSTVARRLSSLRQFYTFLIKKGKIKKNPFFMIKVTPYKSKHAFVNQEDVNRLLKGAEEWDDAEGKRFSALLQILSICDISVNDLVSLPLNVGLNALGREKPFLTLTEKENKIRKVQLTIPALESLQKYVRIRDYFLVRRQESHWLFPSVSQKGHLTRQRFGQLLKELSLKVGLDSKYISLPMIRRGFRHYGGHH